MAIKKKYQQAPKERKYAFIGLPFVIVAIICVIPIGIGVGIIPCLIIDLLCLGIFIFLFLKSRKEHKKWVEEGNKEYRYYDTETGQEVDEHGNPIDPNAVVEPKPQPEPNLDEPKPEPAQGEEAPQEKPASAPASAPAPQKQPETIRGADLTIFGKLLPGVGLGLLGLAFLLRTIMFIRELVDYAKYGTYWENYFLYSLRIIGPVILLVIAVIALVKFFKDKQTINKGYKAFLNLAIWYAVLNIVGIIYTVAAFGFLTYNLIDLAINGSGDIGEMFFSNFVIYFFYIVFAIALIIFSKIANKKSVDSIKNKVFAAIPFGIIVIIEITFMIITGATLPEGYIAPGYFVTATIVLLGAGAIAAIPFLVRFEKEDTGGAVKAAPVVAPVAAAPVYKESEDLEEPKEEKPQKRNDDNNGDPERKSSKKGLIIILIIVAALVLVGGGVTAGILLSNKNNREKGPDDNPSSTVIPPSKSSSSSSSSKSSSKSSSSSASVSKTPKEVMVDICNNIYGSAIYFDDDNENYNYWYSDSGFVSIVMWSDLDESYLRDAAEYVAGLLPSYLNNIDSLHSITWSDGTDGYAQNFVSQDEQVKVEIGSFFDSGYLQCQILSHFNI